MKEVVGDLLKNMDKHDMVAHGCNAFCTMGSGIARSIRERFPEVYEADCETIEGDPTKLGTYTSADVVVNGKTVTVVNLYTQYNYGRDKVQFNYVAFEKGLKRLKQDFANNSMAFPKIGSGLAQGNWKIIRSMIERIMEGEDVTIYYLTESDKIIG